MKIWISAITPSGHLHGCFDKKDMKPAYRLLLPGALLLAALAASADQSPSDRALVEAAQNARVAVMERAARSVVCIFEDEARGGGGSGVVIDQEGFGLTNYHVVAGFVESRRGFGGMNDGVLYPLTVVALDPGGDIALFKLEGKEKFDFATLGDSEQLHVGQWVAAMGNPFVLAEDFSPTITLGVISGLHRYQEGQENALEYADCIQVSTSINPGNSGGPLFDLAGRVIGINGRASFEERGRVNVGLGYAISINQVRRFLPCLYAGQLCAHGTLGATVQQAGATVIFNQIQDAAPADDAGVMLSDELVRIGDRSVRTPNEFNNILAILPAEWPVELTLHRDGRELTTTARLERLPLKLPKPWVVDWTYNLSQCRRIWGRMLYGMRIPPTGLASVQIDGALTENSESDVTRECSVAVFGAGSHATVSLGGEPLAIALSNLSDDARESAANSKRVWAEWLALIRPLVAPPEIGIGWEVRGGDEIDGRIVWVVEQRGVERVRVRWLIDFETHELRGGVITDDKGAEQARWRVGENQQARESRLPAVWERVAGERRWRLRIKQATVGASASGDGK
ncbi:MAG: trypsin-like peptidase domain-containing protein [Phycisphaerales bacterium]|nr:trypsin-like peptidase domain-containing protein [Phycisphaerales bacterium]